MRVSRSPHRTSGGGRLLSVGFRQVPFHLRRNRKALTPRPSPREKLCALLSRNCAPHPKAPRMRPQIRADQEHQIADGP